MLKSLVLFTALSLFAAPAWALSSDIRIPADKVERFFEEENRRPKSRAIRVVNAYAELDFAFGFADGRYNLTKYKIKKIRPNIYALGLIFQKKKGMAAYTQSLASYFWYDGSNRIVFKDGNNKKVYDIHRAWHVEKRETSNGQDIEIIPRAPKVKVLLNHKAGTVYLTLAVD